MIGLKRGTLGVGPSGAGWALFFGHAEQRLRERIGHLVLDVQHVGSTAVPALPPSRSSISR
jgi:GrpB-like predicted nucleotidyltransferase (UPF0157 family)